MFGAYVYEKSSAEYEKHVLLIDEDSLEEKTSYSAFFSERGFMIVRYENDLVYRAEFESRIDRTLEKVLMIAKPKAYIPYDVQKRFRTMRISVAELFPKLNAFAILEDPDLNFDLLAMAYKKNFLELYSYKDTKDFIRDAVRSKENVASYVNKLCEEIENDVAAAKNYRDWFGIAEKKSIIHILAEQYGIFADIENICHPFIDYILMNFGKLSAEMAEDTPVLVSRAMEYMRYHSKKFAIIVMDGMSEFDWQILARSFGGIKYNASHAMAMIPTVTSISRQCLLSNKFPRELENQWNQGKEKKEFVECAHSMGFADAQIGYERGYDAEFGMAVSCAAIIVNDIDDIMHGQLHGRAGMYNDITLLMKQGKLAGTVKRMLKAGFDVYISSDHGYTPCIGMGRLMKSGVELETKSHRMAVLKDFADKEAILEKYPKLIEYPKYYLDKQFDYLLCGIGVSFDSKGEDAMNHGGITIDEVIVPFIRIKAVDNNG